MSRPASNGPTLAAVARRAGVSLGSASQAFSGNAPVSPAMRAAVHRAAEELGYRPQRRRTPRRPAAAVASVALVAWRDHEVEARSPYYGPLVAGVHDVCTDLGATLVLDTVPVSPSGHAMLPVSVRRRQVQGVLIVGGRSDPALVAEIVATGTAVVLVDHEHHDVPVDSVRHDDETGGYLAARHLLQHGHASPPPAIIAGPLDVAAAQDRLWGHHRALREAGLVLPSQYVRISDFTERGGHDAMLALLDLPRRPTAVACGNDLAALGALAAARSRGLSVPGDVSLVGYNDESPTLSSSPPLTTLHVDTGLLGSQAMWHLVERSMRPGMSPRRTKVAVHLLPRQSVAAPADARDRGRSRSRSRS